MNLGRPARRAWECDALPGYALPRNLQRYRPNSSRLGKILFGAAISRDRRMFGNKSLPTKHTKSHESFTTQILLHWCDSRVSWAAFLREPSVLSASSVVKSSVAVEPLLAVRGSVLHRHESAGQ